MSLRLDPRLAAILGTDVPRAEHFLLLLVGSSLLIKNYDLAIFGLAIPQIQVGMLYFLGGGIPLAGYLLAGPALVTFWVAAMFAYLAGEVTLSGIGTELFPTSCRATASAARVVIAIVAGLAGLAAESALYRLLGSHMLALVSLVAVAPLGVFALWHAVPETAGRELEEIAPERGPRTGLTEPRS